MSYLDEALKFTLQWEGGYVNHPLDPGGATNKGVIQSVYDAWRKSLGQPVRPVKQITDAEVKAIYERNYWRASKADTMKKPLAIAVFDTAVNFGVGRAIRFLQQALGVTVDGKWGTATQQALAKADQHQIALKVCVLRIQRRHQRVKEAPSQVVFLKGWLRRDNALTKLVQQLGGVSAKSFEGEFKDDLLTRFLFWLPLWKSQAKAEPLEILNEGSGE